MPSAPSDLCLNLTASNDCRSIVGGSTRSPSITGDLETRGRPAYAPFLPPSFILVLERYRGLSVRRGLDKLGTLQAVPSGGGTARWFPRSSRFVLREDLVAQKVLSVDLVHLSPDSKVHNHKTRHILFFRSK
jgi:hypothetical protein